jgi:predicted nucleic acid-binding protein
MGRGAALTALLDTNVVIRHLTGDPPALAQRATRLLAREELLLTDTVFAETVFVLESFYEVPRARTANLMRAALALPGIRALDTVLLLRALDVYEHSRLHFVDAYLVAVAELSGVKAIASFDRGLDRIPSITRVSP